MTAIAKEPETVGQLLDSMPITRREEPAAVTPMRLMEMAMQNGGNVEVLARLMELQAQWEEREARKAFVAALNAFKARPPTIVKNKHVDFGKTVFDHATLDQVCAIIGPALSTHGLSHRWETSQAEGKIRVTCILTHALGHSESVSLEAGADSSGSKNAIQAVGSTVTYLQRYTLLAITGLAAKGQDDDAKNGGAAETISDEQKETLVSLMKETGADTAKFLAYLCVDSLDELPASQFDKAKRALEAKRKKGGAS